MPPLISPTTNRLEVSSTSETVASRLERVVRRDIIEAQLAPGMPLRLKDLALAYGVGVIPLREALSRLTADGLVIALDQKGFSVAPLSRRDLLDVTRARQHLETIALKDSLALGGDKWKARVAAAHEQLHRMPMMNATGDRMNPDWESAHERFHQTLISGCGSDYLIRFTDILRDQTTRYRHLSLRGFPKGRHTLDTDHLAITNAVLSHDALTACQLLVDHYQKTAELVLKTQTDAFEVRVQPKARPRGRTKAAAQGTAD